MYWNLCKYICHVTIYKVHICYLWDVLKQYVDLLVIFKWDVTIKWNADEQLDWSTQW